MIVFANGNGDILKFVPSNVHQGSNKASTIYFIAPFGNANVVNISFILPNGLTRPQRVMRRVTDFTEIPELKDLDGNGYYIWSYSLVKSITAYAGKVTTQIFITAPNEEVISTSAFTFEVTDGVAPLEPPKDENSYQALLNYVVDFLSSITTTDYDDITNKPIVNADLWEISSPINGYYRHIGETIEPYVNGVIYYYNGVEFISLDGNLKINVDDKLSTTSINPVQNKVIAQEFENANLLINGINDKIDTLHANAFIKVDSLPTPSYVTLGKIYLVPNENGEDNYYNEYLTVVNGENYSWELIGNTKLNVDGVSTDVQINGKSITENGVANIPIAGQGDGQHFNLGLVQYKDTNSGIFINQNGFIYLSTATDSQIIAKTQVSRALSPDKVDLAVKNSVTTNTIDLTDEEKANAQEWLGIKNVDVQINGESIVKDNVANIPRAKQGVFGLCAPSSSSTNAGIWVDPNTGLFSVTGAAEIVIDNRNGTQYQYAQSPIIPRTLDYAVRASLTTNQYTLSDSEQSQIHDWLGIKKYKHSFNISGSNGDVAELVICFDIINGIETALIDYTLDNPFESLASYISGEYGNNRLVPASGYIVLTVGDIWKHCPVVGVKAVNSNNKLVLYANYIYDFDIMTTIIENVAGFGNEEKIIEI